MGRAILRVNQRVQDLGLPLLGAASLVVVWQLMTLTPLLDSAFIATPADVVAALAAGLRSGDITHHVTVTIQELLTALGIAVAVGLPAGAVLGLSSRVFRAFEPFIGFLLSVPIVSFLSVLIVINGFGYRTVVVMGFVSGVSYIILNAGTGFANIDSALRDVGRVYCGSLASQVRRVWIPAALPTILAGTRLAAGRTLAAVVIGEMFAANNGLGAQLVQHVNYFRIPQFYAVLVVLALLSGVVVVGANGLERSLRRWNSTPSS